MITQNQVILGPPGTGKSRTLMGLVDRFLDETATRRVLFCSHTRAAAQNVVERWGDPNDRLDIQTLHSFCFRAMKLSRSQTVDFEKLGVFTAEFGLDMEDGGEGRKYIETISMARCRDIPLLDAFDLNGAPGARSHFEAFARSYIGWKDQYGYMDFDDMLVRYARAARLPTGHTLLAIDEAQDLTPLHWKVVDKLLEVNPAMRTIIAGDEDQCLYEYAGAEARGMTRFLQRGGELVTLEQSYRVPRTVHAVAQRIVERISHRMPVSYQPRDFEGTVNRWPDFYRNGIQESDEDVMVLYGDKFVRREVEEALKEQRLLYHAVGGMPAPLQTKAGVAIRTAHAITRPTEFGIEVGPMTDEQSGAIKRALSDQGRVIADSVGIAEVAARLRHGDFHLLQGVHWSNLDYFNTIADWTAPVRIRISTIHGAKGFEARNVHLICGQSQAAQMYGFQNPDASHRLFYVATTRASENLTLYEGEQNYEVPV